MERIGLMLEPVYFIKKSSDTCIKDGDVLGMFDVDALADYIKEFGSAGLYSHIDFLKWQIDRAVKSVMKANNSQG